MAKIVKIIEVLAQSDASWEGAVKNALSEAKKSVRNIRSIYVQDFQAKVEGDKITQYRVNAKISFDVETGKK
ncbi:MAG: dodecin family protein [Verrucomicrobiales bacterium]